MGEQNKLAETQGEQSKQSEPNEPRSAESSALRLDALVCTSRRGGRRGERVRASQPGKAFTCAVVYQQTVTSVTYVDFEI